MDKPSYHAPEKKTLFLSGVVLSISSCTDGSVLTRGGMWYFAGLYTYSLCSFILFLDIPASDPNSAPALYLDRPPTAARSVTYVYLCVLTRLYVYYSHVLILCFKAQDRTD